MPAFESISAVTLLVGDMRASVAFYESLGFELLYGGGDAEFSSFSIGTGYLNLQFDALAPTTRTPWGRVIIWVDDVDAVYELVVAGGWQVDAAPQDAAWGERYFHVRDPAGHELSFARPIR